MTLERRTPLRRTGGPKRSGRVRVVSSKRAAESDDRRDVRMALFVRDQGRCALAGVTDAGRCVGPWSAHHVVKAWKRPPYTLDVLVTLCTGHNEWVENEPTRAHSLGLVVREGETLADAADRRRAAGVGSTS